MTKRIRPMPYRRTLQILLACLLIALSGCFQPKSGNPSAPTSTANVPRAQQSVQLAGTLVVKIKWPERGAQTIPTSAESLIFDITLAGQPAANSTVTRPESSRTFPLAAGSYYMTVKARPGGANSGTDIATVTQGFDVVSSAVTVASFNLASDFQPVISGISQASYNAGSTISITGSNFLPAWAAANPTVVFPKVGGGTTTATITGTSGNGLSFTIPLDAALFGDFVVTVDGIATDFGYTLGSGLVTLAASTFNVPATDANGVNFTAPIGQGGTTCAFTASGAWRYWDLNFFGNYAYPMVNANGHPGIYGFGFYKMQGEVAMKLIVNRGGSYQVVGTSRTFQASSGETMAFLGNEGLVYGDNQGSQNVSYSCKWSRTGTLGVAANAFSGTSFQVPARADQACSFQVLGNQSWSYVTGGNPTNDANGRAGVLADSSYKLSSGLAGALIVKRGSGTYEAVGADRTIDVSSGELLRFYINDADLVGDYSGNSGSLNVSYSCNDATYGNGDVGIN